MFRARSAANSPSVIGSSIGLLAAIILATGLNFWVVLEIRKEQRAVDAILRGGVQEDIRRLGTLPTELGWQLAFTVVVLVVLIVAAATLVFVVRAYLKSQSTLRDTVTLAQDVLGSIDYGVITTDPRGYITSINPQARALFALDTAPMGTSLREHLPADAPLADMCREVLLGGKAIHEREFVVTIRDGRRDLRADCHSLRGAHGLCQGTVLHIRDVTQQTLLQERMRRMERFMGLGTLAAGLHHEIKNPLSALSLHVQLLEEGLAGRIDRQQAENLNVLKTEVTRIAGVLESFRDYASLEQLNSAPVDAVQIVQQTVNLIRPQAEAHRVAVCWHSPPSQLPHVMGDAMRLEQVLLNLALNALEAMPKGGQLSVDTRLADEQVIISVADTGPGIAESVQAFILEPYFTTKNGGSGMGLAFCDKIVRQHGGHLSFDSGSQGTVFHITLPAAQQ